MKIKYFLIACLVTLDILLIVGVSSDTKQTIEVINLLFWISCILGIPPLLSKTFGNKKYFGIDTILLYLIFPILFALSTIIANILNISPYIILNIFAFSLFVYSNILVSIQVLNIKEQQNTLIQSIIVLLLLTLVLSFTIIIRPDNSILATDYLQHQNVVFNMLDSRNICILPSECSSLFLQDGYTTYYHTILAFLTIPFKDNLFTIFYVIDYVWLIFGFFIYFALFQKIFHKKVLSGIGATLTVLVFTNWAYEFHFFIPQTIAFYFFLILLQEKTLTILKLSLGILVMLPMHFIIGPFLSIILISRYLLEKFIAEKDIQRHKTILYLGIVPVILFGLLNYWGLTIENIYQQSSLEYIGSQTNQVFLDNIFIFLSLIGFFTIVLMYSIFSIFKHNIFNYNTTIAIFAIIIELGAFLIGPTYAGKFLIGYSLFSTIIILSIIQKLNIKNSLKYIIYLLLIIGYGMNFYINYTKYFQSYKREDQTISALSDSDIHLTEYLMENPINKECSLISDPYSQLIVAGFSSTQTLSGQYMDLEMRRAIAYFSLVPNKQTFDEIKEQFTNQKHPLCYLYTARLHNTKPTQDAYSWINNVYALPIENKGNLTIENTKNIRRFLQDEDYQIRYQDENYILFVRK